MLTTDQILKAARLMEQIPDRPRSLRSSRLLKPKQQHCSICGRFMRRVQGRSDVWLCPKVFYDDYAGGYEHG